MSLWKLDLWQKKVSKLAYPCKIEETELFAEVLADPDNCFAQSLDRLGLKNSYNNKVFKGLKSDSFKDINQLIILDQYGDPINHEVLDTPIEKRGRKYKSLKQEWSKLTNWVKKWQRVSTW